MSCWKAIGSLATIPSPTLLTSFEKHSHRPHGIIPTFPICVGGKVINIEVEIIDANLDYSLLLGRNWICEMDFIVSSLIRILYFPHEGIIVKVDQLDYSLGDPHATSYSTIPMVDNPRQPIENLGVGMYSSLMGIFDHSPPTFRIDTISSSKDPLRKDFVRTHYFSNPRTLPSSTTT